MWLWLAGAAWGRVVCSRIVDQLCRLWLWLLFPGFGRSWYVSGIGWHPALVTRIDLWWLSVAGNALACGSGSGSTLRVPPSSLVSRASFALRPVPFRSELLCLCLLPRFPGCPFLHDHPRAPDAGRRASESGACCRAAGRGKAGAVGGSRGRGSGRTVGHGGGLLGKIGRERVWMAQRLLKREQDRAVDVTRDVKGGMWKGWDRGALGIRESTRRLAVGSDGRVARGLRTTLALLKPRGLEFREEGRGRWGRMMLELGEQAGAEAHRGGVNVHSTGRRGPASGAGRERRAL